MTYEVSKETMAIDPARMTMIRKKLDNIKQQVNEVETLLQGEDVSRDPQAKERERVRVFLQHFINAPGHRLHKSQVSAFAKQAGYDPRGVGGYYTGTPGLQMDGDYRVLTEAGEKFYRQAVEWTQR